MVSWASDLFAVFALDVMEVRIMNNDITNRLASLRLVRIDSVTLVVADST